MVRKKKSMIGFDPLAWLDNEKEAGSDIAIESAEIKGDSSDAPVVKKKTVAIKKQDSKKMITVLGHSIDETAILKGYELAKNVMDDVVVDFYNELFDQHPDVKPLFKNSDDKSQADKLAAVLKLLVDNLHNEETLKMTLTVMGERHQGYGVLPDHYPVVAELLVASFKNKIGRSWTKAIAAAWVKLILAAAETMCAAYKNEVIEDEVVEMENETKEKSAVKVIAESDNPVLLLNSIQDISKSQALKNDMLTLINDNDEIDIDASDVERIDGSALQLLCALFNYAQQNNLIINWIKPSDALIQSAQTLGVQQILELN